MVVVPPLIKHVSFNYRDQLNEIDFQNIQILPNSPTQDGDDSILSFFVNLPSGATMPSDLLNAIYSSSPNVISQRNVLNTTMSQNPVLTADQTENLVQLTVNGLDPTQVYRVFYHLRVYEKLLMLHLINVIRCIFNHL